MTSFRGMRSGLAATTAIYAMAVATPAMAQSKSFNVPAQPAVTGIPELARQADVQILVAESAARGKSIKPVKGTMTVDQALRRALSGTGLRVSTSDGRTFTLVGNGEGDSIPQETAALVGDASGSEADQEILVTGSRIQNAVPVSPVHTVNSEEIQRAGYSTVTELTRNLAENFSGGLASISNGVTQPSGNLGYAQGVNLRGLGSGSTLVIVNGHRLAPAGYQAGVDISGIPIAAIERVDVLTDGASAIYGSDAIGGVVNFILKKNFRGAETSMERGFTTDGGAATTRISQLLGTSWKGGGVIANFEFNKQDLLMSDQRSYSQAVADPTDLIPSSNRKSFYLAAHQEVLSNLTLSVDGLRSVRRSVDPITFPPSTVVADVDVKQFQLNEGLNWRIGRWSLDLSASQSGDSLSRVSTTTNATTGGVTQRFATYTNKRRSYDFITTGPLFAVWGGDTKIAAGVSFQQDSGNFNGRFAERDNWSVFGEAQIPLVGSANAKTGVQRLVATAAFRYDKYSDFGSGTTPKLGILYSPSKHLDFSGTWGKSFRAPTLFEVYGIRQAILRLTPDPLLGGANATTLWIGGSDRNLKAEHSRAFTLNSTVRPLDDDRFTLEAGYFNIEYTDRVIGPINSLTTVLTDPSFAPLVIRNPSIALVDSYITSADTFSNQAGGVYTPGRVSSIILSQSQNVASFKSSGVDLRLRFSGVIRDLSYQLSFEGTRLLHLKQKIAGAREAELINTAFNPADLKLRVGASFRRDAVFGSFFVNYVGGYRDGTSANAQPISSWTTFDAMAGFELDRSWGALEGLRASVRIANVFNQDPPFVRAAVTPSFPVGYDGANASPLGRNIFFTLTKRW